VASVRATPNGKNIYQTAYFCQAFFAVFFRRKMGMRKARPPEPFRIVNWNMSFYGIWLSLPFPSLIINNAS